MSYLNFGTRDLDHRNLSEVINAYNEGFVATRKEAGYFQRVRSLRVHLPKFENSSENRRILRKYDHQVKAFHIPYPDYSWEIHKLGKDFYDSKFGKDTFSANKIKELFTSVNTNFNLILTFVNDESQVNDGYCICVSAEDNEGQKILHYAYPFYNLELANSSFGIYMMRKSINFFKDLGYEYIYLGSVHDPKSLYKLQFQAEEWWDEKSNSWQIDLQALKERVREDNL